MRKCLSHFSKKRDINKYFSEIKVRIKDLYITTTSEMKMFRNFIQMLKLKL